MTQKSDKNKDKKAPDLANPKNRFTKIPNGFSSLSQRKKKGPTLWIFLFLFFILLANYLGEQSKPQKLKHISYSEFMDKVKNEQLKEVTFQGNQLMGLQAPIHQNNEESQKKSQEKSEEENKEIKLTFQTQLPPVENPKLLELLEQKKIKVVVKEDNSENWINLLAAILPWLLIFGFFWWSSRSISKRMGNAGRPPFMGADKSRKIDPTKSKVTFKDIAGAKHSKDDLEEIVSFLKNPDKFTKMGATLPRGVLMIGPPGTGKTLMAKAVAGEAGVPFYSMSGSEFIELYVGMGASRVRKLFEDAKSHAPAIIFIDEIDSIGRSRGTGLGGGHDEREQTLNQILAEMDGFSSEESVIVLAATNRPDVLDNALTRPGRFDRQVVMDLPTSKAREDILKIHTRKIPLSEEINLQHIATSTPGFSGADLKNLVNEAALQAAREDKEEVTNHHFSLARDKVLMGNPREEILKEDQKRVIAVHESGHALVAHLTKEASPLKKITIIPRGKALGFTEQVYTEDIVNQSKSFLLSQIDVLLGGRTAEELIIGEITTGAQDDLKRATKLCRKMIAIWGMSDTFGPLSFEIEEEHAFLGREMSKAKNFSEKTAERIDEEIFKLLGQRKDHVTELLTKNKELLVELSDQLFTKETLETEDLLPILGEKLNT
ncbi:MAG: cell division protein FtsH [Halobacteriovoraceae bacterium]|nr:cell division protein FtsH [Halobacteriovoraceae bacterium]|tara:strand:- start:185357 stop:187336 length:1980 start_codon:yes stop_codon:yes gene_type:complete